MGLEPRTFCMASASDRSRPFAQTGSLQGLPSKRANASELERTPNLAILATDSGAGPKLGELLCNPLTVLRQHQRLGTAQAQRNVT
jgi:hypothetical protein